MKRIAFHFFVATLCMFECADAAGPNKQTCSIVDCVAGTRAITYATKQEPFYACPNRELTEYTNTVIGLVVTSSMVTGKPPNISDKTGEPEFQGETKMMLDSLREKANVNSFDQAVSTCAKGSNKTKVIVLNNPSEGNVIYVMNEKTRKTFWLPKNSLDKR